MLGEFKNEAFVDFSREENKKAMEDGLAKVAAQLGREYDLVVGGERIRTKDKLRSLNPSNTEEVVGFASKADRELADRALGAAGKAFDSWRKVGALERARYLWKAAAILRRRKFEFSAWLTFEVGKTWPEADADTAEAIDFLEYYGREMVRLGGPQPVTRYPGEDNELLYLPLGVGLVISPWNFPLAILCGMTSAAVVTGNTVLVKPSSVSPVIAAKLCELFEEAGFPPGVVNFLPASGAAVGDYLVTHPKLRFIAFTGSKEIGLRIHEMSSRPQTGQLWLKRTILEMGGKDSIVVDAEADLDEAAAGVVASAFGFQGQKCSACSRAILVDEIYDKVAERVVERTRVLAVGPARDPQNFMGPVVDESQLRKVLEYVEVGKKEGKLLFGGVRGEGNGYFVKPTVFGEIGARARLAQEEIFGPVLALVRARDFDDALAIANNTEFGLTGAVYSRDRAHLERARHDFHVGNLYFNRKCTGALVGVHPFGGFNMSGTDSKAGGPDYLSLFLQAKSVSERL
ncbi:MAG: L-glutamate gamma-semialdehyde dehydrogenase [Planctomycetes bacterium]|nr:L-glutamate gamma-semialdehyde dehydrogenase [Planctomycetota bacterium]